MAFNIEDTFTKGQVLDQLCTDQKTSSLSRGRGKVWAQAEAFAQPSNTIFQAWWCACHNRTLEMIVLPPGIVDIW